LARVVVLGAIKNGEGLELFLSTNHDALASRALVYLTTSSCVPVDNVPLKLIWFAALFVVVAKKSRYCVPVGTWVEAFQPEATLMPIDVVVTTNQ
jgi:hypothetical protein